MKDHTMTPWRVSTDDPKYIVHRVVHGAEWQEGFVADFESDFVLSGEIVDNPNDRWTPIIEHYRNAKAALAAAKGEE